VNVNRNPSFPRLWRRIRSTRAALAFSLIELLIVVGIIAILVAIAVPFLAKSRAAGRAAACASNQHQIAQGFRSFKGRENRNPQTTEVLFGLSKYMSGSREVFLCPEAEILGERSFGVNPCVAKLGEPSKVVLLDARTKIVYYEGTSSEIWQESVAPRHPGNSMNVLFYGGNVERWQAPPLNPYESTQVLLTQWKPSRECNATPGELTGNCGLCAVYYSDWWTGETATRLDNTIHMPFGGAFFGESTWDIPLPGTNPGGWDTGSFGSGVWFGKIKADQTANYTFHVACDNEAWLYIDGQEILHRSAGGVDGVTAYQASSPVSMQAGEWYDIEVRLRELTPKFSPSHISVKWAPGAGGAQEIPCQNLRPG
jgi:prepilin-type processing-associated H-X9-DG protein